MWKTRNKHMRKIGLYGIYAYGVSFKETQEWSGHSDISTTSNNYTHLNFNSKITSANMIIGVYPTNTKWYFFKNYQDRMDIFVKHHVFPDSTRLLLKAENPQA